MTNLLIVGCAIILCAICVGCGGKQETAKIDTPTTVYIIRDAPRQGDYAYTIDALGNVHAVTITGWLYSVRDRDPRTWFDLDYVAPQELYLDTAAVCRALKSRYEKQERELKEKMKGLECK